MARITFYNASKQTVLGESIDIADTPASRSRGLLKHKGLAKGEGLWIVPSEAIHTFWMQFPIDVVFLDRKKRVTKVVPAMKPSRIALSWRAHSVLELPAGMAAETGTEAGDILEAQRRPAS
jgi:hypothetical protein